MPRILRCAPVVVPKHAAESLAAFDLAIDFAQVRVGIDHLVAQALMVALLVMMDDVRKRSENGVVDNPIEVGSTGIGGKTLFPQPRRQRRDIAGGMIFDTLQHIDQVSVRIDSL